jgi:hypothetical protein
MVGGDQMILKPISQFIFSYNLHDLMFTLTLVGSLVDLREVRHKIKAQLPISMRGMCIYAIPPLCYMPDWIAEGKLVDQGFELASQ